jgi:hypothetical protein
MSDALNPAEQAEADYGDHVIWRLVGAKITAFGGNDKGEIYLSVLNPRDGKPAEFVIAPDPDFPGGVALFEVEKTPAEPTLTPRDWPSDVKEGRKDTLNCNRCGSVFLGRARYECFACATLNGRADA